MALPIGGFMPIPLAMMIPFMATQSMVMGDAFGRAFQYGKRKISAMSNEEFNKTTLEQQASEMFKAYKIIIGENHLQNAILESTKLQKVIIEEMLLILPKFISQTGTDAFGGTDIRTEIEPHPHSISRPHIHSGNVTITGKTISNGITTTYYSDGSTTTNKPTSKKSTSQNISVELTEELPIRDTQIDADTRTKLMAHYNNQIEVLQRNLNSIQIRLKNAVTATGKASYVKTIGSIQTEIKQQQRFLANVTAWRKPY